MKNVEEENYQKACDAHPDRYQNISSAINEMGDEWNPRLHLMLHSIVLNQIDGTDQVSEAFEELTEDYNLHPHSAIHALSAVLGEEIFAMLKEEKEFDPETQKDDLEKLLDPKTKEHRDYVDPLKGGEPPEHPEIN